MAITVTSRIAAAVGSSTSATSQTFSPNSNFTPGSFAVLIIGNGSNDPISSVTDTLGNTWTVRESLENADDNAIHFATCDSQSLTTSDSITVTWSGNVLSRSFGLLEISGSGISYVSSDSATFATNGTITTGTILNGNIVIGAYTVDQTSAPTADSDTTNGSWSSQVSDDAGFANNTGYQYKVVTADGTQTYNISVGVAGVIAYIELQENLISTDPFGQFGFFGI